MSLSSAISNALSGVTASSRGTEVVSTNIANKSAQGYARRELDLSSRIHAGGGVHVDGVRRTVNAGLLADNRLAQSAASQAGRLAEFHTQVESAIGLPNDSGSLSGLLTAFDSAITSAAARPDNEVRLNGVVETAKTLVGKVNSIANGIQDARVTADKAIADDVTHLNATLQRVADLNRQITVATAQGGDAAALVDARQAAIDEISSIIPLQEIPRENGRIALFTKGGATLLDGSTPAQFGFRHTPGITADMTAANGALSAITLNGKTLGESEMAVLSGGTMAANFDIRDRHAPAYQTQIDAFARDLYDRFATIDPTVPAGQPGLLTDGQATLTQERGFAARISVSNLVDRDMGGQVWRIRAGLGAADGGSVGESSLLQAMGGALSASRAPTSANVSGGPRTMIGFASELASVASSERLRAETTATQKGSQSDALRTALLAQGVDTDTEMEHLLTLERAYAANAKVLQTANDMLDQILRLT